MGGSNDRAPSSRPPAEKLPSSSLQRSELNDGTFLVWWSGDNKHTDHWHVAPDGTVLSVKVCNSHRYKRSDVRRDISAVTGISWSHGWS